MDLIKRSFLVLLIMLVQSQNIVGAENVVGDIFVDMAVGENVVRDVVGKNVVGGAYSRYIAPGAKLVFWGALIASGCQAARVAYQKMGVKDELEALKNVCKSLNNGKINPGDMPEGISKKWTMSGWRIKGSKYTYHPDIVISDANYIHLNEQKVIECLYNDLKFREIYIIEEKIIDKKPVSYICPIAFGKPEKTAYTSNLKGDAGKPVTVGNSGEVPNIETLKSLNMAIDNQIKRLLEEMEKLEEKTPVESLAKLLVEACKIYQGSHAYGADIRSQIKQIKDAGAYSPGYEDELIKLLEDSRSIAIDDISDLYLFNFDQLYKGNKALSVEAIKKIFKDLCEKELEGDDKNTDSYMPEFVKRQISRIKGMGDYIQKEIPQIKNVRGLALEALSFTGDKVNGLHEQIYSTYFEVAVHYARLMKLGKVLSKVINMANGYEDKLSAEALLKQNKEKIHKNISDVIDMVKELKTNDNVSYVVLEEIFEKIGKFKIGFSAFDLVKIYGSTKVSSLLNQMLSKMASDVKSFATYFGGNNIPMRNNEDLDEGMPFSWGGSQRANAGRGATIYAEGFMNPASLGNLRSCCLGWLVGLEELEKQSKL